MSDVKDVDPAFTINVETPTWVTLLVGTSITQASFDGYYGRLVLSDGTVLRIDTRAADCCSWMRLETLSACQNVITSADVRNTDVGIGPYEACIHVVTDAGDYLIGEASADATNGYYLHGWALDVVVEKPAPSE